MKIILAILVGVFMLLSTMQADKIIVKVPLDIDGLPNNGQIVTKTGREMQVRYAHLKLEMFGCDDERIFHKWVPLSGSGIHETVTIEKTFASECGESKPQVTVHLYFSSSSTSAGVSAKGMSSGDSSVKSLVITNVDAVRGYFHKVN